MNENVDGDFHN